MYQSFRLRKAIKYQGMAFAAIFLAAIVGYSSILFLDDPAKHGFKGEDSVAVVGGMGIAVFGTMLLVSLYIWAAYYVERFTIHGTVLSIRSMLQNQQFDVAELKCLKWKAHPLGGTIVFQVWAAKARLDLHGYSKEDRLQIIRALRDLVPAELQEGWPLFCHKVALPLRDGEPPIVRIEPSTELFTITRQRYDRSVLIALPLSLAVATALWVWLNVWHFFLLPVVVIGAWAFLRFHVPPEGHGEVRLSSTFRGTGQLIGWGAVVGSQLLMVALRLLGFEKSVACGSACIVVGIAFPPMLYFLHKADKQRLAADEQAAESASEEWRRGEKLSVDSHARTMAEVYGSL